MRNQTLSVNVEHALGFLGLLLMLVVAGLANWGYSEHQTVAGRLSGVFARRAIDGIAALGWLIDRLPPRLTIAASARRGSVAADSRGATLA